MYSTLAAFVIGLTFIAFSPRPFADAPTQRSSTETLTETSISQPAGEITRVVISCDEDVGEDHEDYYYSRLLRLVLAKTEPTFGPYEIIYTPVMPINKRLLREMERGSLDATWMPYARDLEYDVVPVKVRLLKNLSDYRVFLVRSGETGRFAGVKSLEDLRKFKGGIGSHWADRRVMEENGLPLVLSMSYFNLFKMLKSGRFDYFSRGVYQARAEAQAHANQGIVVEPRLLLRYENPVYFYVHKNNQLLAQRLEAGLKIAMEDGSFDTLFSQVGNLRWGEKLLEQNNRRIIQLHTFN